ncbi:hypothetical protein GCM10022415_17220 [Knoellia locipacati]|uniref:Uncharacterized protein n=1 Tax=Knoellia locipacati TaxID=882824 RepID=A0A512T0J0_9MICO|nr:hypothetical protein KLO01_17170 [Knoellia locipacati]
MELGRGGVVAVAQDPHEGGDDDDESDRTDEPQQRVIHGHDRSGTGADGGSWRPPNAATPSWQSHHRRAAARG